MDWSTRDNPHHRRVQRLAHRARPRAAERILCDTNHPDEGLQIVDAATGARRRLCLSESSNQGSQWRRSRYALAEDFAAGKPNELSWMENAADTVYGPQWTPSAPLLVHRRSERRLRQRPYRNRPGLRRRRGGLKPVRGATRLIRPSKPQSSLAAQALMSSGARQGSPSGRRFAGGPKTTRSLSRRHATRRHPECELQSPREAVPARLPVQPCASSARSRIAILPPGTSARQRGHKSVLMVRRVAPDRATTTMARPTGTQSSAISRALAGLSSYLGTPSALQYQRNSIRAPECPCLISVPQGRHQRVRIITTERVSVSCSTGSNNVPQGRTRNRSRLRMDFGSVSSQSMANRMKRASLRRPKIERVTGHTSHRGIGAGAKCSPNGNPGLVSPAVVKTTMTLGVAPSTCHVVGRDGTQETCIDRIPGLGNSSRNISNHPRRICFYSVGLSRSDTMTICISFARSIIL